jgi:hypothetical protein
MQEKFTNNEILEAVNILLEKKYKKKEENKDSELPIDTETIISQAEKYLKK